MLQSNNKEMASAVIQAVELSKRYEDGLLALDVLNLKVYAGEIYCLLGANGAGKTTTINLFLGLIPPTSGQALIKGADVFKSPLAAKQKVTYVSEDIRLYGNLTARQNLEFFTKLATRRGLKKDDYYMVLRKVGLQERAFEQQVKSFSKGMRQKVGIAIAITVDTPAILLDEPTSGLDPKAAAEFMEILCDLRSEGKAILMSTHDVFRAKQVANRVGIMKEGRKIMEQTQEVLDREDLESLYLNYMGGAANRGG